MSDTALDAGWLHGKQIAFTGRLASMTRVEAAALVREFAGQYVTSISRQTAFLVVGQEGLPLTRTGGLSPKLRKARQLQRSGGPVILREEEFLDRLGLGSSGKRPYTAAQLCRLMRVPRDRLRSWLREGLVEPVETVHGVAFFDFQQVTGVKTLWDLAQGGVTPAQIRRSLEQLRQWLPEVERPLAQLALMERGGQILIRTREGLLAEPTGQMHFDFADDAGAAVVASAPRSAEQWLEIGCDEEQAGRLAQAVLAYREALLAGGPNAILCFNLGNVLYAQGQKAQAAERFRQAVELNASFAEAWNNLGNVLAELNQADGAVPALEKALAVNPHYADAHYNLADTLEQAGRLLEARHHWQAYVRLEPMGRWADYARRRLAPPKIS